MFLVIIIVIIIVGYWYSSGSADKSYGEPEAASQGNCSVIKYSKHVTCYGEYSA